ncbi:MAG: phosphatase PAP2 family protein [Flavobacteriales bacterium]|nr:MAG: phosphatase PAP2 family protein [Flavobacteriales bacterium]
MRNLLNSIAQRSRLVGTVCVAALCTGGHAQNTHELRWGLDAPLIGAGVVGHAALMVGFDIGTRYSAQPRDTVVLDRSTVNRFDRIATFQHHPQAAKASDRLFLADAVVPLVGAAVQQQGDQPLTPVLIGLESFLLCSALTNLAKYTTLRNRPYRYNPDAPPPPNAWKDGRHSFWSGHTANLAAITFSVASMLQRSDLHRDAKTAIWVGAAMLPALVGYLRVRAGRHFPTDVLVGFGLGTGVGLLVPYLHRKDE